MMSSDQTFPLKTYDFGAVYTAGRKYYNFQSPCLHICLLLARVCELSTSFSCAGGVRFESGTHPREPVIDLLSLTQLHTASLEDHAKHLTKRVDGLKSLISSAKASGAVKKLLPSAVTGFAIKSDPSPVEEATDSEMEKVEKR